MQTESGSLEIIKLLCNAGHEAVYVGGCVRDSLLNKLPKDWDIATSAKPEEVEALFERTIPVGKSFGVISVLIGDKPYEVATFRGDGQYTDGRRPDSVNFCSAKEDALRRDFTINALMYEPTTERLWDFTGGKNDLDNGIIRAVGDARTRFMEDHLRMLRAIRFAARTGFEIEDGTFEAISELAGLARLVSAERTGQELVRILTEGGAASGVLLLEKSNLLMHILPEVAVMRGMPQPEQFHPEGDVLEHTLIMLKMLSEVLPEVNPEKEILAWGALLHDVGKPECLSVDGRIRFNMHDVIGADKAVEILKRLKRPSRVIDGVGEIIKQHMHFVNLPKMRVSRRRRFLREDSFELHLALHYLDCRASHNILDAYEYGVAALAEERDRPEELRPLLGGKELIGMGYPPGPLFKIILNALEDARLEGEVESVHEAVIWVRNHYKLNNLPDFSDKK